jgi:hypothetical protein
MLRKKLTRLRVESLEGRLLLAANVTAAVSGGTLRITDNNAVVNYTVDGTTTPGQFTVTGNAGTTIDGVAAKTFTGVKSIFATVGTGNNDNIKVENISANILKGDLRIDLPGSIATVNVDNVIAGGNLTIEDYYYPSQAPGNGWSHSAERDTINVESVQANEAWIVIWQGVEHINLGKFSSTSPKTSFKDLTLAPGYFSGPPLSTITIDSTNVSHSTSLYGGYNAHKPAATNSSLGHLYTSEFI